MNYSKASFISDLLNTKHLSVENRERIFTLCAKELDKQFLTEEDVKKLIQEAVESDRKEEKVEILTENKGDTFTHSPKSMIDFLYKFSIDDDFKWFTHAPDTYTDFDYSTYVKKAENEYKNITNMLLNTQTYVNVKNFILDTGFKCKQAEDDYIEFSWKDIKEWCETNPGKHPYNEKVGGKYSFKKYIKQFKNTIEFRTDNADYTFDIRLKKSLKSYMNGDFKISFLESFEQKASTVNVYIDVRMFFSAIKDICVWIKDAKANSNEVFVDLSETDDSYILEIFHKNSFIPKDPKGEKFKGQSGDIDKIRKKLFSIADFSIQADFKYNGTVFSYDINFLNEKTTKTYLTKNNSKQEMMNESIRSEMENTVGGVKYLLRFYKNT